MGLKSGRSDLARLLGEMDAAEGVHAIAGVASFAIATGYLLIGHVTVGMWMLLINVPLNVYPVMLQRSNRRRVLRLIERRETDGS